MKFLIINPTLSGDFTAWDLGVAALATYINQRTKHTAKILDFTFHRRRWKDHLHKTFRHFKPDVIGITCNSAYMRYVKMIAYEIKKNYNIKIIFGGYHASLLPAETLKMEECDAVCIGDGEYVIEEYLNALENDRSVKGIKGLWAKEDGKIIKNTKRPLIQDIDSLPIPDLNLWEDLNKYIYFLRAVYFIGTRGCPYNCAACPSQPLRKIIPGNHYRTKDPFAYVREIKHQWEKYKDRGFKTAYLFDPVFTFDRAWVKRFCEEYKKQGLTGKVDYAIYARADNLDEEIIRMLAESGCNFIRIGIESGDERIRNKIYKKNITTSEMQKNIDLCNKYNIKVAGFFMLGAPGESRETLRKTFELAKRLKISIPILFVFRPFPKIDASPLSKKDEGIMNMMWIRPNTSFLESLVKMNDLSLKDIESFRKRFYAHFIMRRAMTLAKNQKLNYFFDFVTYLVKGLRYDLGIGYLIVYFHL